MDKLFFGLGVAALGMITVFAGLVILIAFITLLSKLTAKEGKKKTESKSGEVKAAAKSDVPDDVLAAISAAIAAYDQTPSPEVVAAIAAALNIVMGEGKFVVRHIKRINNAPAWNRAGREEQIYSRF
ncbi:MAG: OadG family protein [Clostridia bacterium]|nr:OadG family protein [Clostridia bacterium]